MKYLPLWKDSKRLRNLPLQATNDCLSEDGDLSFFGVGKVEYYSKETKDAIVRQVFQNVTKWKKPIGALFIPKKKIDRIIPATLVEDIVPVLTTKHYNASHVEERHLIILKKLFFKYKKQSNVYTSDEITSFLEEVGRQEGKALFSLPNDSKDTVKKIIKKFFKDPDMAIPEFLNDFLIQNNITISR